MEFVWDRKKATSNLKKHDIGFEEACTALKDTLSITGYDPDHPIGELRWITFGVSDKGRLLAVSHTEEGETVRIISARAATNIERKMYEKG